MSKRLSIIIGVLLSLLMVSPSLVAAQDKHQATDGPDIATIGQAVEETDPETLLADLQTPPRARALPDGFTKATYVDTTTSKGVAASDCLYDASGNSDIIGGVGYTLDVDTSVIDYKYTCASINLIVFDPEVIGSDALDQFKEGAAQSAATPASNGGVTKVTDTTVDGEDAVLITYTLKQDSSNVVVQSVAIPVGNVFVVTLVSVGDTGRVPAADVEQIANDLAIAGIEHLATTVGAE